MTTATKPLPPHGSEARYQGATGRPGCRCRTCLNGWSRAGQRRLLARLEGRPAMIPAGPVTEHLQTLLASDMTTGQICRAANVNPSTVHDHARGAFPNIRRTTAEKILAVKPRQYGNVGNVSAHGSIRRLRALYAEGHTAQHIADHHDALSERALEYIVEGARQRVSIRNHDAIAAVYRELHGTPGPSLRAKERAAAERWPNAGCWDDEDIDNPNALPEWTGHCGTDRGWWMHKQQQLPMCERCEQAHADWLAAHRHLPPSERFRALGLARGEASGRGAALAHDARELMRISGLTHDQAAERLGITRQHLHQELCRHPEPAEAAA